MSLAATPRPEALRRRRLSARERRLELVLRRLRRRAQAAPGPVPPGLAQAIEQFTRRLQAVHRLQERTDRSRGDDQPEDTSSSPSMPPSRWPGTEQKNV